MRPPNAGKGRQKGTKNKKGAEVRALAQVYTAAAIRTLAHVMLSSKADYRARVAAAAELLNRGHGRPATAVTGEGGSPAKVEITWVDQFDS